MLVSALISSSLVTLSWHTPRRYWVTTTRGSSFTTTMRVIDWVHRNTANGWANASPALSTGFTELTQAVLRI